MIERGVYESIKKSIIELRRKLHAYPELSGSEDNTKNILMDYFSNLDRIKVHSRIGGNSIAWEFCPAGFSKTLIFRADMDALPIPDEIEKPYVSKFADIGHKCGHDGHMAILSGFAQLLNTHPPEKTRVFLLFQAEEETGQGAEKITEGEWFKKLKPDYIFGLHNLPDFPKSHIIIKDRIFASSSVGMQIKLKGKSSHAGQPEDGISPAMALAKLTRFVQKEINYKSFRNFTLATIIHLRLGEIAFGTSPGEADFMLTLRAADEQDLKSLTRLISSKTEEICKAEKLNHEVEFTEHFPSTVNHHEGYNLIVSAAKEAGLKLIPIETVFRWSEDFGHYLKHVNGAFFGLGAGRGGPSLHNPDYDFPDDILISGVKMFYHLYRQIEGATD
ncbi:MAG: amidohydrolase [Bacteroidota bacterium]